MPDYNLTEKLAELNNAIENHDCVVIQLKWAEIYNANRLHGFTDDIAMSRADDAISKSHAFLKERWGVVPPK